MMIKLAPAIAIAVACLASPALAEKPADPGGFGKDRAAAIHALQESDEAPGASEWGKIAAERAGSNGRINNDYKCANGQVPETASFCED